MFVCDCVKIILKRCTRGQIAGNILLIQTLNLCLFRGNDFLYPQDVKEDPLYRAKFGAKEVWFDSGC